jgi:peptide/nickel transport system permease protein
VSVTIDSPDQLPAPYRSTGVTTRAFRVLRRKPSALLGGGIIVFIAFVALAAPLLAPYPAQGRGLADVPARDLPPSSLHWFGTDHLGRDVLSRVIFGARPALGVSLAVVVLAVLVGVPLGMIAGYRGGWLDEALMRVTDIFLAFPPLLLAMVISALLGASLLHAAIALVISWWPWYARLARTVTQSLKHEPFIDAARVFGVREPLILTRHVLRNATTPILVQATVDAGTVILAVGALAFLGLAAQPPTPDWGLMVADGRTTVITEWWISMFPGLAIFTLVLGFNLLGDVLRDVLDPRSAGR